MSTTPITRYTTAGSIRIYRIPVQVFPKLIANIHVVVADDYVALIDTGSGLGESDTQLQAGFAALREEWGESFGWSDLKRIIITHAHIDHYGGLTAVRTLCNAPIAVHVLDRRVLINHSERLILASRALGEFLARAGIPPEQRAEILHMYGWSKEIFRSVDVSNTLEDGDRLDGLFSIYHTPGHCPGQVCLQIDDILLTADHVLPHTAPFLSPESITPSTGAEHYLQSLDRIKRVSGVRLALGGHEEPIKDFDECLVRVEQAQQHRITRVRDSCAEPRTIAELTRTIYPTLAGYDSLMALQKTGAYVEYLDQRGQLAIANLDEVASDATIAPRYRIV
ncbi:MAG: MBL fold metallo-hydrolase [Roseiflexaceae bacterium]|nr:MBL fold metallo-hydrolase [Roseiflexaceae bacterium]